MVKNHRREQIKFTPKKQRYLTGLIKQYQSICCVKKRNIQKRMGERAKDKELKKRYTKKLLTERKLIDVLISDKIHFKAKMTSWGSRWS